MLRDRELLRNAEIYLAEKDSAHKKWKETATGDLSSKLAYLELSVNEKIDNNSQILDRFLYSLRGCDKFEDFKQDMLEQAEMLFSSTRQLKDTAQDIRERRKEFASDDGTLPIQHREQ